MQIRILWFAMLLALVVGSTAGCQSSSDPTSPAPPSAASAAASRAQQVTDVQNNPNIPPEAKAHISAQIQGQGGRPATTGPTHP